MSKIFIVLWMIFFHIVDDYYLQGWFASAKQKIWWEKNAPDELYKHDYIWALIMHGFSWTYMIMLPIAYWIDFRVSTKFIVLFIGNWIVHAIIDDFKANRHLLNLWQDQIRHLFQILITALMLL